MAITAYLKNTAGTNVQQVNDWLKQAYAYQGQEAAMQGKYNSQSMLKQMGYNTLQAIMQGVYNHIENSVAMNYNSTEALANRNWQEHMSNTGEDFTHFTYEEYDKMLDLTLFNLYKNTYVCKDDIKQDLMIFILKLEKKIKDKKIENNG